MENDNKRKRKALDFPIIKCAKKEVGSCLHLFLSHFPSYCPPTLERTGIKWRDARGGRGGPE